MAVSKVIAVNTIRMATPLSFEIFLKYENGDIRKPLIKNLKRVSKPGLRRYVGSDKLPRVMSGFGLAILSTSKGIMTGKEAKTTKVGGEHLCSVW